jgi:hypothetical protein
VSDRESIEIASRFSSVQGTDDFCAKQRRRQRIHEEWSRTLTRNSTRDETRSAPRALECVQLAAAFCSSPRAQTRTLEKACMAPRHHGLSSKNRDRYACAFRFRLSW